MSSNASMFSASEPYYSQDSAIPFEQEFPELRNKPVLGCQQKRKKKGKTSRIQKKRKERASVSYVKTKADKRGYRLIKIKVYDLSECDTIGSRIKRAGCVEAASESDGEDGALLSAQYIVKEPIDQILDQTESLVNKISKSLFNNNFVN